MCSLQSHGREKNIKSPEPIIKKKYIAIWTYIGILISQLPDFFKLIFVSLEVRKIGITMLLDSHRQWCNQTVDKHSVIEYMDQLQTFFSLTTDGV